MTPDTVVHRFCRRNPYVVHSEGRKCIKAVASIIIVTYILVRIDKVPSQTDTCRTYLTILPCHYVYSLYIYICIQFREPENSSRI